MVSKDMGKLIYKIVTRILLGFAIIFISLVAIYSVKRVITKDNTSTIFGYSFYRVSTGSMIPDINPGDLVIVKAKDEYEVGMDVTYRLTKDSTPVTHRIVSIDGDMITTEGINNDGAKDTPFNKSLIIGEVVSIWSNFDGFVSFVTSPFGLILICAGMFGIVELFSYIDKLVNKSEKNKLSKKELDKNNIEQNINIKDE